MRTNKPENALARLRSVDHFQPACTGVQNIQRTNTQGSAGNQTAQKKRKTMKRTLINTLVGFACLTLVTGVVYAANVHFKRGPTVTDNGNTLSLCASLAGLGNADVTITVTATGSISTKCVSPGGNEAPGQNKIPFSTSVTTTIKSTEIKNGNVSFCVTTPGPGPISARQAGCPNDNWKAVVTDVEFEAATITVEQGGKVVLQTSL
jgi:hypothetical protein